jgi:hypothetical protein
VTDLNAGSTDIVAVGMSNPRWNRDGTYLYYESRELGEIYRVSFESTPDMVFGERQIVFSNPRADHLHWDVPADDRGILVGMRESLKKARPRWKVVLNWSKTLER